MKRATFIKTIVLLTILLFSLSKANAQGNIHFYKVVVEPNLLWEEARTKAAESTLNGVHGHLATINTEEEDKLINSLRQQAGSNLVLWVGGSRPLSAATSDISSTS